MFSRLGAASRPLIRRKPWAATAPICSFVVLAGLLAACSPSVRVAPAQASADPRCAAMMVALPDVLDGQQLRETSSQGTAVWGDPAKIVLRCGVAPPGPTTDPCATVNGVDWLIRQAEGAEEADSELYTVTSYGRVPATELTFSQKEVSSNNILAQLTTAASKIPQQRRCLGPADLATL
ncbi:DUF3515 domain-containing protein [Acaricomes phytoseiuli]|uniref:DUF3515 domain-containing protein n=1 Tax=Acaricomes phytoseiuli TaxID=291968 RepID=UPI0022218FB5|nr:DUF3515 domain-containing protein [Acaricomes phytoseiuli]MCW1249598.1 DUF3515 domain-containing protein [Acaricomes phytoseiuli]